MNYYKFHDDKSPTAGESEYDHIVPVLEIKSNYDDNLYHADDIIIFSDNGESACIGNKDPSLSDDETP